MPSFNIQVTETYSWSYIVDTDQTMSIEQVKEQAEVDYWTSKHRPMDEDVDHTIHVDEFLPPTPEVPQ